MVRLPRLGRFRLPRLDDARWKARLRAQRAWWRRRWRATAGDHELLFPIAGGGVVAVETLSGGASAAGPRIAILHATAGMVAQVVLGIAARGKAGTTRERDLAVAHQVLGYSTLGAATVGAAVLFF